MMMITQQHCSSSLHRSLKWNCRHMHDWQAEQKKNRCHLLRMDGFFVTFHERIFLTFFFRYICFFFLTLLFAMGKSFFYSLRPSTLFLPPPILYRSRSLVFMFCLLCFTLSYKVSTYGIYLYKENSLDDFLRCDFMIMTLNSNQLNS